MGLTGLEGGAADEEAKGSEEANGSLEPKASKPLLVEEGAADGALKGSDPKEPQSSADAAAGLGFAATGTGPEPGGASRPGFVPGGGSSPPPPAFIVAF